MRLRLVADDLTGALDSAAQFCDGTAPIPVLLALPSESGSAFPGERAALDLASRERSVEAAAYLAARSGRFLRGGDPAFKKVDSLLRGHWAAELKATLAGHFGSCVFAPAFPSQGRVTGAGRLWRVASDGTRTATGPEIFSELERVGLAWCHGRDAGASPPVAPAPPLAPVPPSSPQASVYVFDAESDADLSAAIAAARPLPAPVLWCGSAGLARALAASPAARAGSDLRLPLLAIVGSHHPVSDAQVAALDAALGAAPGEIVRVRLGNDVARGRHDIMDGFAMADRVLVTFDIAQTTPDVARTMIEERLAAVLADLPPPATLVATGGETLRAICGIVGADRLDVRGEFAPGVPVSRIAGGNWDGTDVVSKSGALGAPGLLAAIIHGAAAPAPAANDRRVRKAEFNS
jgi:uncharacterized protein YgbK (DUF1537 family)